MVNSLFHVTMTSHMSRLTVAFMLVYCSAAVAADQPPKLRLSEVQSTAPERYRVDLTLDPDKAEFSGNIRIQVKVEQPSQTIWLNGYHITVQEASVTSGGKAIEAKPISGGDDFLGLQLPSALPAGEAEIVIRYTGMVRRGETAGVFQADDRGVKYIMTQFESTDARDAFPCFDEPSYKVPWQLTLRIPSQDKAVSNTPIASETSEGSMRTVVFRETKPLPSYLVAFAVGPLEFVDAGVAGKKRVPVRIVTPQGRAAEAKYAAEVTATILTRLEDYFGIPFPYDKSDQVAVPVTIGFGAMENPGMVTYGQNIILSNPATDSINRQRSYAEVAAHELSHQWFGDLVTTNWWNDIWLNEAFASWMEEKIVAEWKPEWNTRVDDVGSKLAVERQDGMVTARKIRQEIETKGDIVNAFDGITYDKGAAVIGMFENWMGPEAFRKGVQHYMQQYAFRTATAGAFLDALSSSSKKDITKPFSTFLEQAGLPVVKVALDCKKAPVLHLEQSRYLPVGSNGSTNQLWSLPVCVRYGSAKGESQCTLMTQASMDLPLQSKSCPAWVNANDGAKGYYLVDYPSALLSSLTAGDVQHRLTAAERTDLIGNAEAMTGGGRMPSADALQLVESFHNDPSRQVLQRSLGLALSFQRNVVPENLQPNYQRFLRQNFQARARELGWTPKPGESDDIRLMRPDIVSAVATFGGDEELAREARQLAEKWLADRKAVSPDVVQSVLTTSAYYGDKLLFQSFLAEFKRTQDRQDQQHLLVALIQFRDPAAVEAGMEEVLSGRVKLADGYPLLFGGRESLAARRLPFEFVKTHFDEIMKNNPSIFGFSLGSFLPNVGAGFCDAESRKDLQSFFAPLVDKYDGAPRNLAQVLEGIDLCIARVAAQRPSVSEFLAKY
jgi:alanyl aminopeptidase